LKNGDEKAFREIFGYFHKPLYILALKYLKDTQLAEDAVQDIFLKLWINRQSLDQDLSLRGFLFTSLKNHILNIIRNRKTEISKQAELSNNNSILHHNFEDSFQIDDYQDIIAKGLKELSPQRQLIFNLRVFVGLTNQEVSGKLNLSINTVKFQFSQATKSLRKFLKKEVG
jgi:RNA polymerase sigma-70 factor (ECF subfamily)